MASSRHHSEWKHLKGLQVQDWEDVPGTDFSPSAARRVQASRPGKRQSYGDDRQGPEAGAPRRRERTDSWSGLGA